LLASFPGVASAQVNCEATPLGRAHGFYLALNQFYRAQSDLAAAKARNQTPLGIGQLQEQSFQEVNRNSDDKVKPG
jgi:hypothetical protein